MKRTRNTSKTKPRRGGKWLGMAILILAFWFVFALLRPSKGPVVGSATETSEPVTTVDAPKTRLLLNMQASLQQSSSLTNTNAKQELVTFGEARTELNSNPVFPVQSIANQTASNDLIPLPQMQLPPMPAFALPNASTDGGASLIVGPTFTGPATVGPQSNGTGFNSPLAQPDLPAQPELPSPSPSHSMLVAPSNNNMGPSLELKEAQGESVAKGPFFTASFGVPSQSIASAPVAPPSSMGPPSLSIVFPSTPSKSDENTPRSLPSTLGTLSSTQEPIASHQDLAIRQDSDAVQSLPPQTFMPQQEVAAVELPIAEPAKGKGIAMEVKFGRSESESTGYSPSRAPEIVRIQPQIIGVSNPQEKLESLPKEIGRVAEIAQDVAAESKPSQNSELVLNRPMSIPQELNAPIAVDSMATKPTSSSVSKPSMTMVSVTKESVAAPFAPPPFNQQPPSLETAVTEKDPASLVDVKAAQRSNPTFSIRVPNPIAFKPISESLIPNSAAVATNETLKSDRDSIPSKQLDSTKTENGPLEIPQEVNPPAFVRKLSDKPTVLDGLANRAKIEPVAIAQDVPQMLTDKQEVYRGKVNDEEPIDSKGELLAQIKKASPKSRVEVRSNEDGSITVIGSVPDEESAKRILILVRKKHLVPVQDRLMVQVP